MTWPELKLCSTATRSIRYFKNICSFWIFQSSYEWIISIFIFQGEIDAHEDSFKSTDEAGQALLNTGHYASEEVKEKVGLLICLDQL